MSNRRPFSELNEYSLPDLERRIIIAVLHNELDLAEFLNAVDPLRREVDHNRDDVDNTMNSNSSDTDSIASDSLELELDEGEQQQREENDREDQEVAEKENKE
ncbi:Protein CBG27266 [Caenorhabditis briggsae]|uniref:Protein CBG27266 n=1 Tax=Caenorhabditis briggsae TaxID=6238 RepID=B6IFT5_CAEBR|nr:Protein CBG27266 [Caenorhabditis briggsae]CAR98803.1 Protein CBG27266 [Caenorhabditis briggsae]